MLSKEIYINVVIKVALKIFPIPMEINKKYSLGDSAVSS